MSEQQSNVKPSPTFAALKNVSGFYAQVLKLQSRKPALPNLGVMHGPSGYGKSYASIYAQIRTRAIRVEVGESWSRKKLVAAILREGGVAEPRGDTAALVEQAISLLAEEPTRPLFIDEADKLVDKGMIELVRELAQHSQAPVLLIGEEMLPQKLARYERVHNRVLDWFGVDPCDLDDCKKLAEIFLRGVAIDDDLLEDIRIKGDGRARRIVVSLNDANEWARNAGVKALDKKTYSGVIYTGEAPRARSGRLLVAKNGGRAA
ncbi:AAA family ATPase [Methylosinus sp. Sm6]|uniref:AAA family ATPase n=1 Tax=Methylosinus sp. Sm6 TaxID=2866948 RepID=UPI001C995FA1|nr:ATP-binding protein [Methylosinus sp. Sm6]MBY6244114.1 ATP-binding protein [Methylosinus sp. Sm6]